MLDRLLGYSAGRLAAYALAVTGVVVGVRLRGRCRPPSCSRYHSPPTPGTFPKRDLIIFLTFAVIFFTLVVQGLSLPALIRRLGISVGGAEADEETRARLIAAEAALDELEALAGEEWTREQTIDRLRRFYGYRKSRFAARAGKIEDDGYEEQTLAYQQTLQHVLGAQREALQRMRNAGRLSNETMNRILRELDLEESRREI